MKKASGLYTVAYAALLGSLCAVLLTGADAFVTPYREANAKAEEVRNILNVLDIPFDAGASSRELLDVFEKNIEVRERDRLTFYLLFGEGNAETPEAVAVSFAGAGLWGPIRGFISLESDMKTIRGITFHHQEETPGLGGEITSKWFRDQFRGKLIQDESGEIGIRIRRGGGAVAENEVDAITGATMTCEKVEAILNAVIRDIVKECDKNGE